MMSFTDLISFGGSKSGPGALFIIMKDYFQCGMADKTYLRRVEHLKHL